MTCRTSTPIGRRHFVISAASDALTEVPDIARELRKLYV